MNMKWKWLVILRAIVLIGLMAGAYYCLWKNILSPPLDMNWSTEIISLGALVFIYCFLRIESGLTSFLYKAKAVILIPLLSGLFYHWMTRPELKQKPIWLIAILTAILLVILNLIDAIWTVREKCYNAISVMVLLLSSTVMLVGCFSAFYQLTLLGTIFIIVGITDLIIKQFVKEGGFNYE